MNNDKAALIEGINTAILEYFPLKMLNDFYILNARGFFHLHS